MAMVAGKKPAECLGNINNRNGSGDRDGAGTGAGV